MILAREKQAGQGRREARYVLCIGPTEDADRRRFAAARARRIPRVEHYYFSRFIRAASTPMPPTIASDPGASSGGPITRL